MTTRAAKFVLLAGEQDWRVLVALGGRVNVVEVGSPAEASPTRLAAAVANVLRTNGYSGEPVPLAISATACFPAAISVQGVPTTDAKALAYRLEESLPFAAETVVSDFIVTGDRALGVCIKPGELAPILTALSAAGVDVAFVTPAAILAAQGCDGAADVLLLPELGAPDKSVNILALHDGRPVQWATVRATAEDVAAQLRAMRSDPAATITAASGITVTADNATDAGVTAVEAIARAASAIAAGRTQPLLNFRRDALAAADPIRHHRRPLNALLAAAAIFFLAFTVATFIRAARYGEAEQAADAQIRTEFLAQFPNWSGPINVAVVESEHRKIFAAANGIARTVARPSALKTLSDVLSRLPAAGAADVSISRMSFGESSFELEGRVGASEQLDALVTAARGAGLNVTPPQTRKDADNSWSFVLRGAKPGGDDAAAAVAEGGGR